MASARPVVSTRLAGIPELVVGGQTGVLVSPEDTFALTQALEQLLRDTELRLRYGRAGRARIEQHFRIEDTVTPLLRLIEGAACNHRNIDLQPVRPAGCRSVGLAAAQIISRRHTGHSPMFGPAAGAYLIDRRPAYGLPLPRRAPVEM